MTMVNIKDILSQLNVIKTNIREQYTIRQLIQLDENNLQDDVLFWCNDKNLMRLETVSHGTVIVSPELEKFKFHESLKYIIVSNPRRAFTVVLNEFFAPKRRPGKISDSARIAKNAILGNDVFIGENVVIEEGCVVGNSVTILHNTVIHANTRIADNVTIGSNNTIGGVGFGYEKNEEGEYELISHVGNVIIEENVEIGNNTCIDRAVIGSTILKKNAKVDNLVHIAHGVVVGRNSLIIAHAMIGGSTIIGDNNWVAPGALLLNKIATGNQTTVGMGAVVIRSVPEGDVVVGSPAKSIKKDQK